MNFKTGIGKHCCRHTTRNCLQRKDLGHSLIFLLHLQILGWLWRFQCTFSEDYPIKEYKIFLRLNMSLEIGYFVKWCSHNEIQSNSKVYSSFVSIYINPVIYSLLIKVAWEASVWVAYINLLISGAKVKGRNYFTKVTVRYFNLDFS